MRPGAKPIVDRSSHSRSIAWIALLGAFLLLAACDLDELTGLPRDVSLVGALLDDEGDPWADATVFVADDGGAATSAARADVANGGDCDAPSTDVLAWGCTDAEGRFELTFSTQRTQFELVGRKSFRVVRIPVEVPASLLPGTPATIDVGDQRPPDLDPVADLRAAIGFVLPGLHDYSLVTFPDEKVVADLEAASRSTDGRPKYVGVPL